MQRQQQQPQKQIKTEIVEKITFSRNQINGFGIQRGLQQSFKSATATGSVTFTSRGGRPSLVAAADNLVTTAIHIANWKFNRAEHYSQA